MTTIDIRPAHADDAATLASLIEAFNVEFDGTPGLHTEAAIRDAFFGEAPTLRALIAWDGVTAVGHALYYRHYDTVFGGHCLYMHDLYVTPARRSQGIGRRLLAALAKVAADNRDTHVWWGVDQEDDRALAFYRRTGAVDAVAWDMHITGDALAALAREAEA
jgi:GNAT superfamily N-acetyltransferase